MIRDIKTSNIPSFNVTSMAEKLSNLYATAITEKIPFKNLPTPFLWGPPGVGKSQGVRQMGEKIAKYTGNSVKITDIRLLLFSPIDLRGVPVADSTKSFTDWLKPRIFDMEDNDNTVNILLLDELSAAPQSIQAAAYQICLDRRIGEHILPDNCIVMAAGNRTTDQSISYKMPKALANRLMHIEIVPKFSSWKEWAIDNGIDERIIVYLENDESRFCVEPTASDLAYPTPRSWQFVSNIIKGLNNDELLTFMPLIAGCVGMDSALEFTEFTRNSLLLPPVKEIRKGKCFEYPKSSDELFTLVLILANAIKKEAYAMKTSEIENICEYVSLLPNDYIAAFVKSIGNTYDSLLMGISEFKQLLNKIS